MIQGAVMGLSWPVCVLVCVRAHLFKPRHLTGRDLIEAYTQHSSAEADKGVQLGYKRV